MCDNSCKNIAVEIVIINSSDNKNEKNKLLQMSQKPIQNVSKWTNLMCSFEVFLVKNNRKQK